ncbi:DUF4430 domain-containing protein (plasmid) [Streptomyces sp. BI20]|uniref:DUF4430 domain-containing protein n=1 Tax=Streptomyces sp. BI20 TaxID=3403460 RepID=UPI003C7792B3
MRPTLLRRAAVTAAALGLGLTGTGLTATPAGAAPAANTNAPVLVKLTVRGPDGNLFTGLVLTKGHEVTTATGGTHRCDGTNGAANPGKVPTPTAALDDAAKQRGFGWDGTWYAGFDDYSVDTIKNVSGGGSAYWSVAVNGTPTPVGGCQFRIRTGDKVSFTWTSF